MGSFFKDYFNSCKILEHYNYTKDKLEKDKDPSLGPVTVVIIVFCCFIILENLLVLVSVWRNKKFHSAMYIFIGNLAFSDSLLAGRPPLHPHLALHGTATHIVGILPHLSVPAARPRRLPCSPGDMASLLRTVTFVLGAFIICWLPAFIVLLIDALCPRKTCTILYQAKYFFAFATLNSAINPLIYTLRSKDMRKEFLRVLCCWGMMGQGKPAERCMIPLRSSSSLDRCTQKQDLTTSPFMKERSTFV
ncbi:LOW QUALITY PROTEIN: sphingosine 1-phosphate receptor 2 [Sphaerodactylus townsendi]|uniref:LOW QUALITY PROTEIN: sphingosine 1-phosphate receptor 2 n=1 Tax=Sphaerodactylus townsendi TaxID=933632 RepID=UPI002026A9D5|nr:LOW QUALITY PROTEIN: sphingosine 1-phosphate receptor 2 [Sphaerodactylus townsendi]